MKTFTIRALLTNHKIQAQNLLSLMVIQVLNTLIPFFLFPYLVKTLGQIQYGQAAFVISLINFLQIIVDFGFNYTGTRQVALAKDNHERSVIFFSIFIVKLLLLLGCLIIGGLAALLIAKVRTLILLFAISSALLLGNVMFPIWFFQGMEKMKIISAVNFIIRMSSFVLILLFVKSPAHTERYIIINAVSSLIPGVFCFFYCIALFKLKWVLPTFEKVKSMFRDGYDLFISNLIIGGYSSIRVFIVGVFCSGEILGIYSILDRIYFIMQTFPLASFLQATYPKFVKEIKDNRMKVINFMRKANKYLIAYFIVAVISFVLAEKWLLHGFLNLRLPSGFIYLSVIMGATLVLINSNTFRLEYLLISGNDKLYRIIHFFTGILGSVTLVTFTYEWGVLGCAVSLLLSASLIQLYTVYVYKKKLGFVL